MAESKHSLVKSVALLVESWATSRSKDPRTKVAACIYDQEKGGMYFGYNGFPKGILDHDGLWENTADQSRLMKYDLVVHAEQNAIIRAAAAGVNFSKSFLVCSVIPCPGCMKNVIAANGLIEVYYMKDTFNSFTERDRMVVQSIAHLMGITMKQI